MNSEERKKPLFIRLFKPQTGAGGKLSSAPENRLLTVHKHVMTNTIYIHQPEQVFSFTRLPNFLFEAPIFQPMSNEAKLLYTFILLCVLVS